MLKNKKTDELNVVNFATFSLLLPNFSIYIHLGWSKLNTDVHKIYYDPVTEIPFIFTKNGCDYITFAL